MHFLDDFTRLFLTIENISEKNESGLNQTNIRLLQGKQQFECIYRTDPSFRKIKNIIPAGIEETGVLLFEPLTDIQDPVKFRFKFYVEQTGYCLFDFEAIKISNSV